MDTGWGVSRGGVDRYGVGVSRGGVDRYGVGGKQGWSGLIRGGG